MGKKAAIFVIVGVVLGCLIAGGGIFFMINNGTVKPAEEKVEIEEFDLKDGKRLTLEKVQIPLVQTGSKISVLQADFTIIFKSDEALTLAEAMEPDIKDAIFGVFEGKTAEELKAVGAREKMKEPILEAIRKLYNNEEDREEIFAVMIPAFIVA